MLNYAIKININLNLNGGLNASFLIRKYDCVNLACFNDFLFP